MVSEVTASSKKQPMTLSTRGKAPNLLKSQDFFMAVFSRIHPCLAVRGRRHYRGRRRRVRCIHMSVVIMAAHIFDSEPKRASGCLFRPPIFPAFIRGYRGPCQFDLARSGSGMNVHTPAPHSPQMPVPTSGYWPSLEI